MLVRLSTTIAAIWSLSVVAFAQGAALTDPQIAHITYTAGQLDIAGAKQALSRSTNKDVRAFAQDMVRDHAAVNKQALALVHKLKVTPQDNDTSRALTKQATDKRGSKLMWPMR
jgi:putative membrane protein